MYICIYLPFPASPCSMWRCTNQHGRPPLMSQLVVTSAKTSSVHPHRTSCNCLPFSGSPLFNVALYKPTWQTTTSYNGPPELAVDGNPDAVLSHGSCTHTYHSPPIWGVDLQMALEIHYVEVVNRLTWDCEL